MDRQIPWRDRSHGGNRLRKRSPPALCGAANKSRGKNPRSSSRLKLEIPDYYRNASARTSKYVAKDGKINPSGVDGERNVGSYDKDAEDNIMTSGESSQVHRHSESKYPPEEACDEQSKEWGARDVLLFDKKHLSQEHPKSVWHMNFTSALERHGSSPLAWKEMASELNSTERNVKVYAYSYFKALIQDRDEKSRVVMPGRNGHKRRGGGCAMNDDIAWSFQELVLLDTLLVKFCPDLTCLNNIEGDDDITNQNFPSLLKPSTVWDKIASQLPGKTARDCKEEGISRLMTICNEQLNTKETATGRGAASYGAPS
jgi:hypothetical protein